MLKPWKFKSGSNRVVRIAVAVLTTLLLVVVTVVPTSRPADAAVPTFTKVFSPDTIGPGSVSTLTFTIDNSGGATLLEDMAFTDVLPVAVIIADPANASFDCPEGTLTAAAGSGTITFAAGGLGVGGTCTISVDVTASVAGVHTNTTGDLTSSEGNSGTATDDLTVVTTLPGFSKAFAPATISLGAKSTLTFTIDNTANGSAVTNLDFTDELPAGMIIADPAEATTTCGTATVPPTLTADAGATTITLDANGTAGFPAVASGATCTVSVDVEATGAGTLDNISGDLLASFVSAGRASASLEVTVDPLNISKDFVDDPVPPGGTVTLDFVLENFDRVLGATSVAFTDDLAATLPSLTFDSLLSNDCGGTVAGVGTTTITFSGGTIAAEGSCTISVSLAVPAGATPGSYTNTTTAISGIVSGAVTGNMATDDLFVEPIPILTKEFLEVGTFAPDPVVAPGDDVVLSFTVTNTSTTGAATDVEFLDELTDGTGGGDPTSGFLPFPVTVTLPPVPDPPCGVGSSLALVFVDTDRQGLELSGGSLAASGAAGDSCSFDVTVTIPADFAPGIYLNTTEEVTAFVDGDTRTGEPASDDLTVVSAPQLSKAFTDDPGAPGGSVTLEFTLTHSPDATGDATAITFTDDLAGLVPALAGLAATGLPLSDPCGSGSSLDGTVGDTFLTLTGGTLAPGADCTFSVTLDVPAGAMPGSYLNTTSEVGATVGGIAVTSIEASDVLDVAGMVFTKEFLDNPVIAGDTTPLVFTIENVHPTDDATISFFTDSLSTALAGLAATLPPTSDDCGGSMSGTTFLTYVGGAVSSGASCTIEVEVTVPAAAADGTYTNITSSLSATQGGVVTIDPAVGDLVVQSELLELTKEFIDDPALVGDTVTLDFTLTNLDAVNAASDIDFTDDLDAALTDLVMDSVDSNDCGGTVTGTATITVADAVLPAGGSCTISVTLSVPALAAAGPYTNTTSSVTGTIDGFAVTGSAASDVLEVITTKVTFSKSFDGPSTATGTPVLTFTLTNLGSDTATGLGFFDDLDAVIPGLVATGLPQIGICGTASQVVGTDVVTFTAGALAPGASCTITVDLLVPDTATAGTFGNTTSVLRLAGVEIADPATADLTIEPPPTFAKAFSPDTILAGGVSTLTFTIDNSASAVDAADLDFTDVFPTGMVVADPANTSTTCTGGTLGATAGAGSVSFTGGSVSAGATCTVEVDVTAALDDSYSNTSGDLTSSSGDSGSASDSLAVSPVADVSVTKDDGVTFATSGKSLKYTIVVANAGPSTDPSVSLTDTFPTGLTCAYTSVATGGASGNTASGSGNLAETLSMPAGSSVTYTAGCAIASSATGTLSNTATVAASVTDPVTSNDSATDSDTVLVSPCNGLAITINMNTNGGNGIGTAGDDVILGTSGDDSVNGLAGNDTICAGDGNDTIRGGPGIDTILGEAGDDVIRAGGAADTIRGGPGADTILGQGGRDVIDGGGGNDTISGLGAADVINGGGGNDIISGQNGADRLNGGAGNDVLRGQTGPDILRGGNGNDTMIGGQGADTLTGGPGTDVCAGNTGPDKAHAASCEQTPGVEMLF